MRSTDLYAAERIMEPLNRLLGDFEAESGLHTVNIVAGWRSQEYQEKLYDKAVREQGAEHAERYVALPGESEHHTGLAVDFALYFEDTGLSGDFDGEGAYAWIRENAWRYGFVQRYPCLLYTSARRWGFTNNRTLLRQPDKAPRRRYAVLMPE